MYLVSLGKIEPPEGMEDGWTDPYPLPLRVLALVKWTLLVLFQVCTRVNSLHVGGYGRLRRCHPCGVSCWVLVFW